MVWGVATIGGLCVLGSAKARPGIAGNPAERWPRESRIRRDGDRPTLVVFLHPRCPCSRATLTALERIAARVAGRAAIVVAFVRPAGTPLGWERTGLWEQASRIPGGRVVVDPGGDEARRFGGVTSGLAALYDSSGLLIFRGGITALRGHDGDAAGIDAILSLIDGAVPPVRQTPTFGCPLFAPCARLASGGPP